MTATATVIEEADALATTGRAIEAIERLTAANRDAPDGDIERRLVDLRHEAFALLHGGPPEPVVPAAARPRPPGPLPELTRASLTVDAVRDGIATHGCVLVRGLISQERAASLRDGVDRALGAYDNREQRPRDDEATRWFRPFRPRGDHYRIGGRQWMRESGGVWAVDSPHMLFVVTELVRESGIGDLITEYFGERPALSANKCNLRRVPVDTATNWHQDGAFLGEQVASLNLWLALGDCGIDAPSLDIVPKRIDHVLESGTDGAYFDWSVSPTVVAELAEDAPVIRPVFGAGDALLFDHLFLHRTGVEPGMTVERHAIESWFFAPSSYPEGQIPILY